MSLSNVRGSATVPDVTQPGGAKMGQRKRSPKVFPPAFVYVPEVQAVIPPGGLPDLALGVRAQPKKRVVTTGSHGFVGR